MQPFRGGGALIVRLQQLPLPLHEFGGGLIPVAGEVAKDGFGRDECGINLEFVRVVVANFFQVAKPAELRLGRALRMVADDLRKFFLGHRLCDADGFEQVCFAARVHPQWNQVFNRLTLRGDGGNLHHFFVGQNEERRAVGGDGLAFAPVPQFAQDREGRGREEGAALDAPDFIGINLWWDGALGDEPGATFLMPREPVFGGEFGAHFFFQRLEETRVVAGVFYHARRERTLRPIGFLRPFVELHAEKFFHERTETELPFAKQTRGEHRIKNFRGREGVMLLQQAQIVIGGVKNQFATYERIEKRIELHLRERVNQFVAGGGADLNETDFFRVGVETVRLGVNREPSIGFHGGQKGGELFVGVNHVRPVCRKSRRMKRILL